MSTLKLKTPMPEWRRQLGISALRRMSIQIRNGRIHYRMWASAQNAWDARNGKWGWRWR